MPLLFIIISNNKNDLFIDAHRLFDKNEYSACIVFAYSELVHLISHQMNLTCDSNSKTFTLTQFFKKDNFEKDYPFVNEIRILRNKIIHQNYTATKEEAQFFLNSVEEIMKIALKNN